MTEGILLQSWGRWTRSWLESTLKAEDDVLCYRKNFPVLSSFSFSVAHCSGICAGALLHRSRPAVVSEEGFNATVAKVNLGSSNVMRREKHLIAGATNDVSQGSIANHLAMRPSRRGKS